MTNQRVLPNLAKAPGLAAASELLIDAHWKRTGYEWKPRMHDFVDSLNCGRNKRLLIGEEDPMLDRGRIATQAQRWREGGARVVEHSFPGAGHLDPLYVHPEAYEQAIAPETAAGAGAAAMI